MHSSQDGRSPNLLGHTKPWPILQSQSMGNLKLMTPLLTNVVRTKQVFHSETTASHKGLRATVILNREDQCHQEVQSIPSFQKCSVLLSLSCITSMETRFHRPWTGASGAKRSPVPCGICRQPMLFFRSWTENSGIRSEAFWVSKVNDTIEK